MAVQRKAVPPLYISINTFKTAEKEGITYLPIFIMYFNTYQHSIGMHLKIPRKACAILYRPA